MDTNILYNLFQGKGSSDSKAIFDLGLIKQEKVGDILFIIGTLLYWISANQSEQAILKDISQKFSGQQSGNQSNNSSVTIAMASWIFLIASLIFSKIALIRLSELRATMSNTSSSNIRKLKGTEIATIGNIIKSVGFAITAIGNQISAQSNQNVTIR